MQRTYWHLEPLKRKPTQYEIVSSHLLYHPARGFEVKVPVGSWYQRYQQASLLRCSDWEQFKDPRETTYTKYTDLQKTKEVFVEGLLRSVDNYCDQGLSPSWIDALSRVLSPLRYAVHGLQMIASYVGQMAPSGRIVIASLFQVGDEIRRVQRLAYLMRQLQQTNAAFGEESKAVWQQDPLWQPLREVIEKLLVTYDWGESFVALNLVLKPMFDELFMTHFGQLAQRSGDHLLEKIFFSLNEDCRWHREWSHALVCTALRDSPDTGTHIRRWIAQWRVPVRRAMAAFAPVFEEMPEPRARLDFSQVMKRLDAFCGVDWAGVELPHA